ncbi:MAG: hypothetical protein AB1642_01275 [Pseudomonadota bacterium]
MKKLAILMLTLGTLPVAAQVSVQANGSRVVVGKDISIDVDAKDVSTVTTGSNSASVTVGGIGEGVNVQGVTVINGKVWIDGEEIPPGVKRHKSKSGTIYRIERKNGAVSVTSE